jgi:uncharacterized phiE125 gp8 family phage protein
MLYWPSKSPGEIEDFTFDFTSVLQQNESIATADVTATGVSIASATHANGLVTVNISAGVLGATGIISCSITTDSAPARTYAETAILPIGEEPVSLDMAKRQVRAEGSTVDDDYLLDLIQASREHVEQYCGIRVRPEAREMTFGSFIELERLSLAPLQEVVEIRYLDTAGAEQVLDQAVYEVLDVAADPLRPAIRLAYGQSWPSVRCAADAVRVSATVGYTVVPRPIIRAMLMLVTLWYDNRSGIAVDVRGTPTELPHAVTALLANYRR